MVPARGIMHADGEDQRLAAMVVTTDAAVPAEVVEEIVASEGFVRRLGSRAVLS